MNRTAFRFPQPIEALHFDGERFVSGLLGDVSWGDIQSEHYHRYLFALQFCDGKDVLDIASGEGYGSHCLGQVARSVVGVDANTAAVDFANRNYLTDRVSFKVGRAQSIPIDDASIDVLVSFETLEHFEEHEAFASESRRVLRPGGLLVISSPNRIVYTEEANYHNEWHVRELDRNEFLDYLRGAFANVRMFAQRPVAGSVIAIDEPCAPGGNDRPEGFILHGDRVFHRTDGIPYPPFFVALASDAELPRVRASVLQNPTLLHDMDIRWRHAADEAARALARATDLEIATATAERDRAALSAELDHARSVTYQQRTEAERASAAAESASRELSELRQQLDQDVHAGHRINTVRQELSAARQRNQELVAEVGSLQLYRNEYKTKFDLISQSTAWRVTEPLRRLVGRLPPVVRDTLRSGLRLVVWRTRRTSADAAPDPIQPAPDAIPQSSDQPSLPSDLARKNDTSWVDPNERPEFISLRGLPPRARIAVVVHVYYPELWPELAEAICNIPEDFDLFVTLVSGAAEALAPTIRERFPGAHVLTVDNHGRDIFPFLALIRTGVLFNYELLCKVHSKRSAYREGGDAWRKTLVDGILGSTGLVERILEAFRSDTDLGMVVASGQIFGGRTFWVSNEVRLCRMFRDIGLNENAFERKFAGGSMYWIRPLILRPVNALNLGYDDFEAEPISSDGFTAHAVERIVSVICHDAGMRAAESGKLGSPAPGPSGKVHVIANYLPQFHPTPENDAWWGKGFTEWTNVTKALPQFRGHRQPRLPTDLGFYDLRLAEIRIAQADLARRHGITAFSYYYYWFNGRKLLNQPIESVLAAGQPDFPFMLCWANEPWTRNWDGLSKEVLLSQDYAPGWERVFAVDVAPLMRDPRYLRLNGKPMLALYRVAHFADMIGSIERLRAAFAAEGFAEVHLIGAWVQIGDDEKLPAEASEIGLDAYFEFPPHGIPSQPMQVPGTDQYPGFAGQLYDYGATVDAVLDELALAQPGFRHRGVMMGWDNTARRGARSFAFHGATPANFRRWLRAALQTARWEAHGRDNAVFINAWNEWAEGTYLEPDRDFGMGWLEAVASATSDTPNPPPVASRSPVLTEDFLIDDLIRRHMQPEIPDALARYTCGLERNHPEYVRSGAEVYLMFELTMRNFLGKSMIEMGNVLDFGCGAGRLLRFLDPSTSRVCACDVNAAVIRFAQAHYGHFSIYQNGLMPPLIYDSGQFDLIYSFSVFSHLSEDVENQWLAELSRVGKSGCIYLISVHGDWFIEATLGDEARAVAEAGFVWKSAHQRRGSEDDFPDYYEASFHTSDFIRAHWSRYFEIVAIVKGDDPRRFLGTNPDQWSLAIVPQLRPMGQDLIIARKR